MRFLLDLELDISWKYTRHLVAFSPEINLVATFDASVDVDVQDFSFNNGLLALAALASISISNGFAFSLTIRTDCLKTLDHRAHLSQHSLDAGTIAAHAFLDSALLASPAIAGRAQHRLLQSKFRDLALVDILERDFVNVVDCPSLLRTSFSHATAEHAAESTSTTKELCEEILCCHATAWHASLLFKAFLPILIIYCSGPFFFQHLVRFCNLLEFFRSVRILVLV